MRILHYHCTVTVTSGDDNCIALPSRVLVPLVQRIWHMTSFLDITDVLLHILVEYTLLMKNQADATLDMLSIVLNLAIFKMATIAHYRISTNSYLIF